MQELKVPALSDALFLAQKPASQIVDEVQPVAGGADHRPVGAFGLVIACAGQPMLHVHSGLGAFVNDRAGHVGSV